jgi:hypothetical protein
MHAQDSPVIFLPRLSLWDSYGFSEEIILLYQLMYFESNARIERLFKLIMQVHLGLTDKI